MANENPPNNIPNTTGTAKAAGPVASERAPDWERIELDYRAGSKTLRQIAEEHGITHGAINKRAKRDGWERDLSGKIKARADALVSKSLVSKPVSTETGISERQVVEANAEAIAGVRLAHRRDIQRSRGIVMRLLEELERQAGAESVELLERLGYLLRQEDDRGQDKLNDLYMKVISLPGRAKTMKDLGESLRVLVALERQAFGLDEKNDRPSDALNAILQQIATSNSSCWRPVSDDPEHEDAEA